MKNKSAIQPIALTARGFRLVAADSMIADPI